MAQRLHESLGVIPFIIFGVVGFGISATLFGVAANEKHIYDVSPSCQAGFALRKVLDGNCHLELDRVDRVYRSSRLIRSTHAVLINSSNQNYDVRIAP